MIESEPLPGIPQSMDSEADEKAAKPRKTYAAPFDMVEDRVRARFISVAISVLVYIMMAFILVQVVEDDPDFTTELSFLTAPIPNVYIGMGSQTPRQPIPSLVYAKTKEPIVNQSVHVKVKSVNALVRHKIKCDSAALEERAGTLEGQRLDDVCTVELTGGRGITDETGFAKFEAFNILGGPPGAYELEWVFEPNKLRNATGSSLTETITMQPRVVVMLGPDNDAHPHSKMKQPPALRIGEENPAFSVGIYDESFEPVEGAKVWAFTWHSGDFFELYPPKKTFLQGQNLGLLENAVSAESDSNGTAIFTNLKLIGATSPYVYLAFYCQGTVLGYRDVDEEWFNLRNTRLSTPKLGFFFKPTYVITLVDSISIVRDVLPPGDSVVAVTEGDPLPIQPQVRVVDVGGKPLAGKIVFALLFEADGYELPRFYEPSRAYESGHLERRKQVVHAVSNATDANGLASFANLGFSVRGKSGNYRLKFVCDGVHTGAPTGIISVRASVARVQFISYPNQFEFKKLEQHTPQYFLNP
jgi:hypothetical protein